MRRFSRSGLKPDAGLGAAVVELAGNLPYDVQRLAHETWDEVRAAGRRRATLDDLHQALHRLLAEQETMFEAIWQRLTLAQRAVLRAVVLADGRELLSADVRTRYRLGGTSSVQTALGALVRDDLITRDGPRYRRGRFAAARMDRAAHVLTNHEDCHRRRQRLPRAGALHRLSRVEAMTWRFSREARAAESDAARAPRSVDAERRHRCVGIRN